MKTPYNTLKSKVKITALCVIALGGLTACGNVKETLGLEHEAPDEFAVIKRAPLEMPPTMVLPPPRPGAQRPQEQAPEQMARDAVFGGDGQAKSGASSDSHEEASTAESALLQRTGAQNADPKIRSTLDQEAKELQKQNRTVVQKLLGKGDTAEDAPASVVDAQAEAKRIQKNIKEGKPLSEGETPTLNE